MVRDSGVVTGSLQHIITVLRLVSVSASTDSLSWGKDDTEPSLRQQILAIHNNNITHVSSLLGVEIYLLVRERNNLVSCIEVGLTNSLSWRMMIPDAH